MKKQALTRMQKFARYRQQILTPKKQSFFHRQSKTNDRYDSLGLSLPMQWFIRLFVTGLFILLILVLALIYFGR